MDLYEEFKLKYKIPAIFINRLNTDKEFKIFNTPNDQKKYIDYWLNRSY